ncbi:MAG TPA: hypothetical protein VFT50_09260 [Baekduia sp.]|nr:hypothetical protein [Baekduia sp.]
MNGSGRAYAKVYERVQRASAHGSVLDAVQASGGRVLFASGPSTAPLFVAAEGPDGDRTGICAYVFTANQVKTKNRPADEHRAQIRYGDVTDANWRLAHHPLGFDPADLDLTAVLVTHVEAGVLISLDPRAYDPLPLGNSVYFKDADVRRAQADGWAVWERNTHGGVRKGSTGPGLETVVAFTPDRLFDYLAVERQAQTLQLDSALRFPVAVRAAEHRPGQRLHELEEAFGLSSTDLLDIVNRKSRLAMAMRGGVAEHHLGMLLDQDPSVQSAVEGHQEGPPDFFVTLCDGRAVTVECKNASPQRYADGTPKVEVQKTRTSQGDPASRYYAPSAFDVVAACMYGPTGDWAFKFRKSINLTEHEQFPGRIAPLQRISDDWADSLVEALAR